MGYTHYYEHADIDQDTWDRMLGGVRAISGYVKTEHDIILAGPGGTGRPWFESNRILFNGLNDPQGEDNSYETFQISRFAMWDCCKTNYAPYDLAVCMVLLHFEFNVPGFTVSSDGRRDGDAWMTALQNYRTLYPHHEVRSNA